MNSTERQQFDGELAVLFGGWPRVSLTPERTEAYWRGLQKMPLALFTRCVDAALSEQSPKEAKEGVPTPNTLWQISRNLRAAPQKQALPLQQHDDYHCLGQKWLFAFLLKQRGVDPEKVPQLVAAKNRIVEQFRASGEAQVEARVAEWLDVAMTTFDRVAA